MRFRVTDTAIDVYLSERNLLTGLHKLRMEGSAREITSRDGNGGILRVHFEGDAEHYTHRDRRAPHEPGVMHPETEMQLAAVDRVYDRSVPLREGHVESYDLHAHTAKVRWDDGEVEDGRDIDSLGGVPR